MLSTRPEMFNFTTVLEKMFKWITSELLFPWPFPICNWDARESCACDDVDNLPCSPSFPSECDSDGGRAGRCCSGWDLFDSARLARWNMSGKTESPAAAFAVSLARFAAFWSSASRARRSERWTRKSLGSSRRWVPAGASPTSGRIRYWTASPSPWCCSARTASALVYIGKSSTPPANLSSLPEKLRCGRSPCLWLNCLSRCPCCWSRFGMSASFRRPAHRSGRECLMPAQSIELNSMSGLNTCCEPDEI